MSEYVIDPDAAHQIIRGVSSRADDAAQAASRFGGGIDPMGAALGASRTTPLMSSWLRAANSTISTALTRTDNIVGAGHEVVRVLEEADVLMAAEATSVIAQNLGVAGGHVDKGMSR